MYHHCRRSVVALLTVVLGILVTALPTSTATADPVSAVVGVVSDYDGGAPPAGTVVTLYGVGPSDSFREIASGTVAADGSFSVPAPAGYYFMSWGAPGRPTLWWSSRISAGGTSGARVEASTDPYSYKVAFTSESWIIGTTSAVRDSSTHGKITAVGINGSPSFSDRGFYSAPSAHDKDIFSVAVPAGSYRLRYEPDDPDIFPEGWIGPDHTLVSEQTDAAVFTVSGPMQVVDVGNTLIDDTAPVYDGTLSGTVRDRTGAPLANATVDLWERQAGAWRGIASRTTDAAGRYTLDYSTYNPIDAFTVSARAAGLRTTFLGQTATIEDATTAPVADEPITFRPIRLATVGSTLAGRVTDRNGQPLANVTVQPWREERVHLQDYVWRPVAEPATTDAYGRYRFVGTDAEVAETLSFDGVFHNHTRRASDTIQVDLDEHEVVNFRLWEDVYWTTGVAEAGGEWISGAEVTYYRNDGTAQAPRLVEIDRRTTGVNGYVNKQFRVGNELYTIQVRAAGYKPAWLNVSGGTRREFVRPGANPHANFRLTPLP